MKQKFFALLVFIEKHWFWPLLGLLGLTTLLWTVHFAATLEDIPRAFAKGLFYSLQFIVLNKELDDDITGCVLIALTITQFALPLLASSVVLGGLFREQMRPIWIRKFAANNLQGHHIVIGYGDLGKALVSQLNVAGKQVVAIDIKELDRQENERLIILQGDARLPIDALFAGGQLKKASCLYLLLPDENENLRLLERLQEHFKITANKPTESLKIYLRTETHALGQLFSDWVGLTSTHGQTNLDIRPINPYDIVARGVVNLYSPDCYVPTDRSGPIAQTIMIVGTSRMAQSLLLRFARIGIYAPQGKLRILWVGDDVLNAFELLTADYPLLDAQRYSSPFFGGDATTDREYYELNLPPIDLIPLQGRADLLLRAGTILRRGDGQLPAAIYVCHDSDILNIKEARDLQAVLGADSTPSTETGRLILALQNQAIIKARNEHQWMRYEIREESIDANFSSTLVEDKADQLAERFKIAYDKADSKDSPAWSAVSYFEKESNRDAADHGAIKARYAGLSDARVKEAIFQLSGKFPEAEANMSGERTALYIMEQRRYRAFMFMMGFKYMESNQGTQQVTKDDWRRTQRINPTLLQKRLSEYELDKDKNIVRITSQAFNWRVEQGCESLAEPHASTDHHTDSEPHHKPL
jgi:hypothetical protein